MSILAKLVRAAVLGLAVGFALPAAAQEITPEHLAAALDAFRSAQATRGFDTVLPSLAQEVENRLIQLRPDLNKQIVDTVQGAALKLAARRVDLDNEVARIWAQAFTEDELKTIATFYKSDAGIKFASVGPKVVTDTLKAVQSWSGRLGDELMQKSRDDLKAQGITF